MMLLLRWIVGVFLLLLVVFIAGAFVLPRDVEVARSVDINASASEIFPHVNSLKMASAWSPWLGRDPEAKLVFEGPEDGIGAKLTWASEHPQVGNGSQIISASEQDKSVTTDLDFGGMGTAQAKFDLAESASSTAVTWSLNSDNGYNPIARWMGLMMDRWVGGDYEAGLANLKKLVEGGT